MSNRQERAISVAKSVLTDCPELSIQDLFLLEQAAGKPGLPVEILAHIAIRNSVRGLGFFQSEEVAPSVSCNHDSGFGLVA